MFVKVSEGMQSMRCDPDLRVIFLVWVLVLYGFLACSKPRVLLGDYPNLRVFEVVWVKP